MKSVVKAIFALALSLSTGVVFAQLHIEQPSHDFGTIAEEDGPVEHTFVVRNTSAKPVVIVSTAVSCGCTKTEFSRKPIMPDSTSTVKVIFNPLNYPGVFARKVAIVTAEGVLPQQLLVKGEVTPRPKSIAERYPIELGEGIRIATNAHHFTFVEHGKSVQSTFEIVNTSSRQVTLAVENPNPLLHFVTPASLAPSEEATLNFGYSLTESSTLYGTMRDKVYLTLNGKKAEYPLIVSGVAIDSRDEYADNIEPSIVISKNFIKFGAVNSTSAPQVQMLSIENCGESPLIIRTLEFDQGLFTAEIEGDTTIRKGEKRVLTLKITPSSLPYGAVVDKLNIVSNAPSRPLYTIRVSAIVER